MNGCKKLKNQFCLNRRRNEKESKIILFHISLLLYDLNCLRKRTRSFEFEVWNASELNCMAFVLHDGFYAQLFSVRTAIAVFHHRIRRID